MNCLINNIISIGILTGFIQFIVGCISTDSTVTCYGFFLITIFAIAKAITYK